MSKKVLEIILAYIFAAVFLILGAKFFPETTFIIILFTMIGAVIGIWIVGKLKRDK